MANAKERLRYVRRDQRESMWFLGDRIEFLLTGEMTEGRMMMYWHHSRPHSAPPLHEHQGEDEILFVQSGGLTFWAGDEQVTLGPGDIILLPRDLPHTFCSLPEVESTWITLTSPAGFENFIREMSVPAAHEGPDHDWQMTPEIERRLEQTARRNGITILAPHSVKPRDFPGGTEPVR